MFGLNVPHVAMSDNGRQQHDQLSKDGRIFPIFYKMKIFSLEETRDLEKKFEQLLSDNQENLANEKVMLEKIRERDDVFVARLETYLEQFKNDNVEEVILIQDMLPEWSPQKKESQNLEALTDTSAQTDDDSLERLKEWYNVMEIYVTMLQNQISETVSDWFTRLDKISNKGEPDADVTEVETRFPASKQINLWLSRVNVFWCLFLIFACLMNVYFVYKPEDVQECKTDPGKCIVSNMMKFCVFVHDHYLAFHNISLENSPLPPLNCQNIRVSS